MALALRGDGGAFRGASVERARERARGLCIFLSFYFSIYLRLHQSTVSEVRGWQKDEKGWKGGLISAAKTPTRSATPEDYRFELCVECAPTSLPPAFSSLTHTRRLDGLCNQVFDTLRVSATCCHGHLRRTTHSNWSCRCSRMRARLPLHTMCAHERVASIGFALMSNLKPVQATPLPATSAELCLGLGLG